jgi:hypothetical protein
VVRVRVDFKYTVEVGDRRLEIELGLERRLGLETGLGVDGLEKGSLTPNSNPNPNPNSNPNPNPHSGGQTEL